ncbi:MAG: hypothetical protein M1831_000940 [Alyxoria varia]|nr:MAG: hypothetical protein M1831_000940 [Alyxoria varia]
MGSVYALDDFYLAITLLITIAYQLSFFTVAWLKKFDKLTDFAGGTNFVVLAIITLSFAAGSPASSPSTPYYSSSNSSGNGDEMVDNDGEDSGVSGDEVTKRAVQYFYDSEYGPPNARRVIASIFIMLWGARLSGFLLFRILKTGKDDRFDDKRDKFFPFLGFWVFQMLWVWTVSLPVTILNSPAVGNASQPNFGQGRDIAGVILFILGFVVESVGDAQKYRFKMVGRGKTDKGAVCDTGVWSWSRHPNYFGEILLQFSIFMICVTPAAAGTVSQRAHDALYASILGPFFLTLLLLFVSGLPLNERPAAKKRYDQGNNYEGYMEWVHRTSILIPLPPQIYQYAPIWLRRTLLMEWPIYVFDPAKHSDKAKDGGAGAAEEGRAGGDDGESARLASAGAGTSGAKQAPSTSTTQPSEIDGAPAYTKDTSTAPDAKQQPPELLDSKSAAVPSRKPVSELPGDGNDRGELPGSEAAAEVGAPVDQPPVEMGGGSAGAAPAESNSGGAGRGAELHF